MRHKKLFWVACIVLILVGTMAAAAGAQNRQLARKRQVTRNALLSKAMFAGLNLSQEQKDQLKGILAGHKEEIQALAKKTAAARRELAAAIAGGADPETQRNAYDKTARAGWDRLQLRLTIRAEVKNILTPEQLQKMEKRKQVRQNLLKRAIKK